MAHLDALQDVATIYTISIAFKAGDNVGQQVKTETPLYQNIPCRLNSLSNAALSVSRNMQGKQEDIRESWIMQVGAQYNAADRGFKVVVNNKSFIITKKQELRGRSSAINHVVYYLEESK